MAGRRDRRSYLNEFQRDVNGEYQYRGAHCRYTGPMDYSELRRGLWLRCGIGFVLLLAAGCLPGATAGAAAYVTLPYMLALAACGVLLWTLARWTRGGPVLRAYVYAQTVKRLPAETLTAAILSALGAAGQGIALLTGSPASWTKIVFFACLAAAALLFARMYAAVKGMEYRTDEAGA